MSGKNNNNRSRRSGQDQDPQSSSPNTFGDYRAALVSRTPVQLGGPTSGSSSPPANLDEPSDMEKLFSAFSKLASDLTATIDQRFQKLEATTSGDSNNSGSFSTPLPDLKQDAQPGTLLGLGKVDPNRRMRSQLPRDSAVYEQSLEHLRREREEQLNRANHSNNVILTSEVVFSGNPTSFGTFDVLHFIAQCAEVELHMAKPNSKPFNPFEAGHLCTYPKAVQNYILRQLQVLEALDCIPDDDYLPIPSAEKMAALPWGKVVCYLEWAVKPPDAEKFEAVFTSVLGSMAAKLAAKKVIEGLVKSSDSAMFHHALLDFLSKIPRILRILSFEDDSNVPFLKADPLAGAGLIPIIQAALPKGLLKAMVAGKKLRQGDYFAPLYKMTVQEAVETFMEDLIQDENWHFANEQGHRQTRDRRMAVAQHLQATPSRSPAGPSAVDPHHSSVNTLTDDMEWYCSQRQEEVIPENSFSALHHNEMNPARPGDSRISGSAKFTGPSTRSVNWEDNPLPTKKDLAAASQRTSPSTDRGPSKNLFDASKPFPNESSQYGCVWQVLNDSGCTNAPCKQNHTDGMAVDTAKTIMFKAIRYLYDRGHAVIDPRSYVPGIRMTDMKLFKIPKPSMSALAVDKVPPIESLESDLDDDADN